MTDESTIHPETVAGYAHGKRNFRRGIGFPRGFKHPGGSFDPPPTAFRSRRYGEGYIQGWEEEASRTPMACAANPAALFSWPGRKG